MFSTLCRFPTPRISAHPSYSSSLSCHKLRQHGLHERKVPAGSVVANGLNEDPNGIPVLSQEKAGTTFNQRDMARVVKTQELRVSTSRTLKFYSWGSTTC